MTLEKTLIFTVTPGRSGSNYLSQLLNAVPGLHAEHEPEPNFVHVMRRIQHNPDIAFTFLREHKLPAIAKVAEPIYAETSHLTCKGFIEPMILLGLRPGLIFLRRSPREVAWSLLERGCIPARDPLGFSYLLEPRDPFVLPLIGWETLSDYQLCFWYALEIERRCLRYSALASSLEMPTAEVTNKELNDWAAFSRLLSNLNLPATDEVREAHTRISAQHHNPNISRKKMPFVDDVAAAEEQVWSRIAHFEPLLRQNIQDRYAP
jgi:hypothetical protein